MKENNNWPDPARPGEPLNPERDQFHWLTRKNGQCPEAWRWDPDADGCGTEYSGAWAESEGDGQPEDMAKWYRYLGPCLTPAEVEARVTQARRDALFDAHQRALLYANTSYQHVHLPVDLHECAAQVAMEIANSISGIDPDIRKAGYAFRRKVLETAAQKAEMVIATGGPWPNIPAAIRALKGEAMTDPIRAAHGEMALQALEIIEEWAKTGKVEIARSLMGVGYEVGHLASNSVAVRETVFEAVLAAAKDDQK